MIRTIYYTDGLNTGKSLVAALRSKIPDQLDAGDQILLPQLDLTDPYHRAKAKS